MGLVTTGPAATVSAATVFAAFRSVGKDPSARLASDWLCRHGIGGDCDGLHRDGTHGLTPRWLSRAHAAMVSRRDGSRWLGRDGLTGIAIQAMGLAVVGTVATGLVVTGLATMGSEITGFPAIGSVAM